jgi:hypothetical protein
LRVDRIGMQGMRGLRAAQQDIGIHEDKAHSPRPS